MSLKSSIPPISQTQTTVATPGTSLSTGTIANVTSKALGPGTYLVWGVVNFLGTAATLTPGSPLEAGIAVANNAFLGQAGGSGVGPDPNSTFPFTTPAATTETIVIDCGPVIVTLAATTTIYLNAVATFSAGTVSAFGTLSTVLLSAP